MQRVITPSETWAATTSTKLTTALFSENKHPTICHALELKYNAPPLVAEFEAIVLSAKMTVTTPSSPSFAYLRRLASPVASPEEKAPPPPSIAMFERAVQFDTEVNDSSRDKTAPPEK